MRDEGRGMKFIDSQKIPPPSSLLLLPSSLILNKQWLT
jgi:hypothetical protein